jgi:hypothetical protein
MDWCYSFFPTLLRYVGICCCAHVCAWTVTADGTGSIWCGVVCRYVSDLLNLCMYPPRIRRLSVTAWNTVQTHAMLSHELVSFLAYRAIDCLLRNAASASICLCVALQHARYMSVLQHQPRCASHVGMVLQYGGILPCGLTLNSSAAGSLRATGQIGGGLPSRG